MKETDLYPPIKRFLEAQGYTVKAEVHACDVMARRGEEPPIIIELKLGLTLQLLYQAIDRLTLSEKVYIAIAKPKRAVPSEAVKLCKRLGLGLIVVSKSGSLDVLADPAPYAPRVNKKRTSALLKEFHKRKGDPNTGGSTKTKLMTAYKQDALRCLVYLHAHGATKISDLRKATKVDRAATILRADYYGWFVKEERGIYGITDQGANAMKDFAEAIAGL
ncbi:MAG: hypothetical protein KGO94_04275 [Alphaproteobacteria bacterium]|nr:hypothetical protein [Alphaproteobacteria bacterium]